MKGPCDCHTKEIQPFVLFFERPPLPKRCLINYSEQNQEFYMNS